LGHAWLSQNASEWVVHPFFKLLQGKDVSLFDYASLSNFDKETS
jgi:hypothetical protein